VVTGPITLPPLAVAVLAYLKKDITPPFGGKDF
jgi:hypothetical protein